MKAIENHEKTYLANQLSCFIMMESEDSETDWGEILAALHDDPMIISGTGSCRRIKNCWVIAIERPQKVAKKRQLLGRPSLLFQCRSTSSLIISFEASKIAVSPSNVELLGAVSRIHGEKEAPKDRKLKIISEIVVD